MLEILRKNKRITNACIYLLILMLCVIILQPMFEIAQYNRPGSDDYDYGMFAYRAIQNGGNLWDVVKAGWDMVCSVYNEFSGLYTSAFILALHPGIWGEKVYGLSTWIIFGTVFFFTFWSVYILNKHFVKRSLLFVLTATFVLLTMLILWLPSAWQALYWYNGSMNYMPFVFMNFLNLCLLIEMDSVMQMRKGKVLLCISMVLSFLISGGNHVTSFANILMLLFTAVYKATKKQYHVFLPLLMACVGFAVMYFSPGTQWRQRHFDGTIIPPGVLETIIATIKHWIFIIADWASFSWGMSIVAITPVALEIVNKNPKLCSKRFPLLLLLLSGAVVSGMFCVPYKAMGDFGGDRLINVIWITFMVLSWVNYVLILGWLHANAYLDIPRIVGSRFAAPVAVVVVVASLLALYRCNDGTMSNSMWAMQDLRSGAAESFAEQMDDRIAKYNDPALTEVAVPPIEDPPRLLYGYETTISTNPEDWPNVTMSQWYGGKLIYELPAEE